VYKSGDRQTKLNQLWSKLVPNDDADTEPADFDFVEFPSFFTQRAQVTFCNNSDEIKKNRVKSMHAQGLVAKVRWQPVPNNGFTGIYATGSDTVVMRISETQNLYEGASGLTPSVAFKFLIDGEDSRNIFGMNSFRQGKSWNFFENPLTNRVLTREEFAEMDESVDEIMKDTMFKKMVEANGSPFATAVAIIANRNNDGTSNSKKETEAPYELVFRAPQTIKNRFSSQRSAQKWYEEI